MGSRSGKAVLAFLIVASCVATPPRQPDPPNTVNDITQLNPIKVADIAEPKSVDELGRLVGGHPGPISIGGGRFSQGGQTACAGCLFIDMRRMNRIVALDESERTVTVEAGITWREIQEAIDPKNLSPKIMQSFSNFTIGGSISVNCHGDYVGLGPLVESLRSIKLVLADGTIVTASRNENRDLFDTAVGGYGGIGVIAEATLELEENSRLERTTHRMRVAEYSVWHDKNILGSNDAVLHHGVIYPPAYSSLAAEVSKLTDKPVTIADRLAPQKRPGWFELLMLEFVTHSPLGQFFHEHVYDPMTSAKPAVVWRNFEAAQDVYSLEPASRAKSTYALQEYFVPVDRFDAFVSEMRRILNKHKANVLNVAVRHTRADYETVLSWARGDVYSFVLYYEQRTDEKAKAKVGVWTRELVDAAIAEGGSYYLPYQVHATRDQFLKAYPRAEEYFAVKRRVDPNYKFRNRLWEAYFR
jgi:FAD/FMN-containing dehydrogenase